MIKNHKKNYVSINGKVRGNHHTVGRLTQLVHTIEKINSNLEDHPNSSSGDGHETGVGIAQTNDRETIGMDPVDGKKNDNLNGNETFIEDKELCFKVSQLVTELLLMLFAASLLCIATVVIFSRKTPAIMESYEIVPKILFFLCVIVATGSFLRWLVTNLKSIFSKHKNQNIKDEIGDKMLISHKEGMAEEFIKLRYQDQKDQAGYIQEATAMHGTAAIVGAGIATSILGDRNLVPTSVLNRNKNVSTDNSNKSESRYNNNDNVVLKSMYTGYTVTTRNMNPLDERHEHPSTSNIEASDSSEVPMATPRKLLNNDLRPSNIGQSSSHLVKFITTNSIIDEETSSINDNYS